MHTASQEFLLLPEESAECHQTLSSQVGSGHETKVIRERLYWGGARGHRAERHRVGMHESIVLPVGGRFRTVLILYPRPHNQVEKVW